MDKAASALEYSNLFDLRTAEHQGAVNFFGNDTYLCYIYSPDSVKQTPFAFTIQKGSAISISTPKVHISSNIKNFR